MFSHWLKYLFLSGVLAIPALPAAAAEQELGKVYIKTALRTAPARTAKIKLHIPADTRVTVLDRSGIWYRVGIESPQEAEGWVRRFDVRLEKQRSRQGSGSGVGGFFSRLLGGGSSRGNQQVTSTIGIRGLDEEMLRTANPDMRQLEKLKGFRSSPGDAAKLAESGELEPLDLNYPEKQGSGLFDW